MRMNRIAFKLGIIIVSLLLTVLLSLGFVVDKIFSNMYYQKSEQDVAEMSSHFVEMVHSSKSIPTDLISTMAEFSKVEIFVLDRQGELLGKSSKASNHHVNFITATEINRLLNGESLMINYSTENGESYLISGKPLLDIGGGVLVISSLDIVNSSILEVRQLLCLTGLIGFIIAVGVSFFLSRKMSGPLVQMEKATRKIAAGHLDSRVEVSTRDEIGSLAAAINDLAKDLQRYQDTRTEFFANISHELKTPIMYLEGYANVISKGLYETEEDMKKYLDIISQEAKRLNRLIIDLFDLSKMEEGKLTIYKDAVCINKIIEQVVSKVSMRAENKGITIKNHIDLALIVNGDPGRLEQIFLNLLDNSIRYTKEGSIEISAQQVNNTMVCISVTDTGSGISKEELPFLFERFYRVEKSRSREHGGTGLGLAITKMLVELHNGSIRVSSEAGKGTRFEVYLEKEY
ncbi:HAMP domain-containing sensor histidine kinase (plasmid) [Paenibacillus urinalis]|uniref:histidine kinase n=1 Tax=Paenibacillus urinalis TaxID=521520 RepID=A0ABY7XLC5_9BACL|nr:MULTISPECIES: HAMP domain-containing sensor histidine kinase [Paenibacillus]MCM3131054.1 HAMP domain-containing histidine kinase [Paenibacillus sp. MER 78]WDH95204.1 HAMP domain-containing sensor histidine kinase [Paenibacillus urinalis]WDI05322.1 HAMP domain-containing sensor histidine kinase [Paenibacillus urinalis]